MLYILFAVQMLINLTSCLYFNLSVLATLNIHPSFPLKSRQKWTPNWTNQTKPTWSWKMDSKLVWEVTQLTVQLQVGKVRHHYRTELRRQFENGSIRIRIHNTGQNINRTWHRITIHGFLSLDPLISRGQSEGRIFVVFLKNQTKERGVKPVIYLSAVSISLWIIWISQTLYVFRTGLRSRQGFRSDFRKKFCKNWKKSALYICYFLCCLCKQFWTAPFELFCRIFGQLA